MYNEGCHILKLTVKGTPFQEIVVSILGIQDFTVKRQLLATFILAILAAIFAAISNAISRRVNYWRFKLPRRIASSLHGRFKGAAKSHLKSPQKSPM